MTRTFGKILVFAIVFSFTASVSAQQNSDPETVEIPIGDSVRTAWIWGQGELVVALPGRGADVTRYRTIGPLIAAEGYRFVAINQRGIRGSSGSLADLTLHDYARDVADVIDYFSVRKAHLIGWALGNRIQRTVATDFPEKVVSVTLLAAGGLVPSTAEPGALNRLYEPSLPVEEKMSLARKTLFSPATSDAVVREYAENLAYWPEARQAQVAANQATPREEWWGGGYSPMLIVQGLDDLTAPVGNGRQMREAYGDRIELIEIADAGHLMGLEKPEETVSAIVEFLRRHPVR